VKDYKSLLRRQTAAAQRQTEAENEFPWRKTTSILTIIIRSVIILTIREIIQIAGKTIKF
jgi:hypothetical protein